MGSHERRSQSPKAGGRSTTRTKAVYSPVRPSPEDLMERAAKKAQTRLQRDAAISKALQARKAAAWESERRTAAAARRRAWAASEFTPAYRAKEETDRAAEVEKEKERRRAQERQRADKPQGGSSKYVIRHVVSGGLPGRSRRH